ncbi:MAG: DUF308 domain-containing protein [Lachnospiraceae bacterium]|nr:DUF308 domain-containing protein [Lachnospiraceae bacterium]
MNFTKEAKWQNLIGNAIYIILGIVLLVFPEATAKTFCYVIGISGIVIGVFTILIYLFREVQKNYYRNDFVVGSMEILLGAVVLYKAELIASLIPYILGILVVFSGILKLQTTIDVRRMRLGTELFFLILSLVNIVWGVVLILDPFRAFMEDQVFATKLLFIFIGVGLLFSGISDTIATLYMSRMVRRQEKQGAPVDLEIREITDKENS